jgi:hypothetical protein
MVVMAARKPRAKAGAKNTREDGGDDRPIRYEEMGEDGTVTVVYRASSLGMCDRAMLAAARGYPAAPHPDWFQEVLDEGTQAEGLINAAWEEETGVTTCNDQSTVELEIGEIDGKRVIIRGHIDGDTGPTNILREYKKFRDSTWGKFITNGVEINNNYPWQVSVYMHGGRYDACEFVGGHWDGEQISEIYHHHITMPPIPMKAIRLKIARIERMIAEGWSPTDQHEDIRCNETTYPCPYWKLHTGQGRAAPTTPRSQIQATDQLLDVIAEWNAAKVTNQEAARVAKEAAAAMKAAQEKLVDTVGVGNWQALDWTIDVQVVEVKEHVRKASTYIKTTIKLEETP